MRVLQWPLEEVRGGRGGGGRTVETSVLFCEIGFVIATMATDKLTRIA